MAQVPAQAQLTDVDRLLKRTATFLLRNSAEGAFDLAATLRRIGEVYGVGVDTLVQVEGMVMIVSHPDGRQYTTSVHTAPILERFDLVSEYRLQLNRVLSGELTAAEADAALVELEGRPEPYPTWLRFLGVVMFAAGFAPSMQATWGELGTAVILGAVMAVVFLVGERTRFFGWMLPLIASTAVAYFAFTFLNVKDAHGGPVLLMVPALFVMIPGDFLCAAAAEISVGQFTVGTIRLVQSFFTLFQLAAGVVIGAAMSGAGTSALMERSTISNLPWWLTVAMWVPFSVGLALTFCARRRDIGWITALVFVAWGVQLGGAWLFGATAGTFLSAVVLTLAGGILARPDHRPPAIVMIIGGVFVLTVGSMALRGFTTFFGGHLMESFTDLSTFAKQAGSLTFGLILGSILAAAWNRRAHRARSSAS